MDVCGSARPVRTETAAVLLYLLKPALTVVISHNDTSAEAKVGHTHVRQCSNTRKGRFGVQLRTETVLGLRAGNLQTSFCPGAV